MKMIANRRKFFSNNYRGIESRLKYAILSLVLVFAFLTAIQGATAEAGSIRITTGDDWRYYASTESPPYRWARLAFDSSLWNTGPFGIGYGTGILNTELYDMQGHYDTVFARKEFNLDSPRSVTGIILNMDCDGPFAVYLNGKGATSNNYPMNEAIVITGIAHELRKGKNILAVQCSNDDINSSDFYFDVTLEVTYE